ncbi:hypothetical protein BEN30_06670 [Magnetovibrio blakemorei]|uniref:Uncharacterized protein n=2 Tax=Magnetovibrio blakemorei TaxID=28181 RepID=A0A1E5Q9R2_9PROT|nr:hypothetical protein BEN30_06670 [Magnetovibrio blakemorei]
MKQNKKTTPKDKNMLELIIIWAISLAGLGIGVLLTAMLVRHILMSFGRIVFFSDEKTSDTLSANAA